MAFWEQLFSSRINSEGPKADSVAWKCHACEIGCVVYVKWFMHKAIYCIFVCNNCKQPNCTTKGGVSGRMRIRFTFWKGHVSGRIEGGPRRVQQMR